MRTFNPPPGFRTLFKGKAVRNLDSADEAIVRLRYIVAMDRAKLDGRTRVANLYRGPGNQILFDQPLTILADEQVVLDYEVTADGELRGFASIHHSIGG